MESIKLNKVKDHKTTLHLYSTEELYTIDENSYEGFKDWTAETKNEFNLDQETFGEVLAMHKEGQLNEAWKKKILTEKTAQGRLNEQMPIMRRRRRKNEYDGDICIDTYMSGDPMYYRRTTKVSTQQRIINVMVNVSAHCGVEASTLRKAYSAITNNIKELIRRGYLVEVTHADFAYGGAETGKKTIDLTLCKIKEANKPLDEARLLTMAHPSTLRVLHFNAINRMAKLYHETSPSYGLGQPINQEINKGLLPQVLQSLFDSTGRNYRYYDLKCTEGLEVENGKLVSK